MGCPSSSPRCVLPTVSMRGEMEGGDVCMMLSTCWVVRGSCSHNLSHVSHPYPRDCSVLHGVRMVLESQMVFFVNADHG